MNTKELAAELDAIRDSVAGLSEEHEAKVQRVIAFWREIPELAIVPVDAPDFEHVARSAMAGGRHGPRWQADAYGKAVAAFRAWMISAGLMSADSPYLS